LDEVARRNKTQQEQEALEAKQSFERTQRDMNLLQKRHHELTLQLDEEVRASRAHLQSLEKDITKKNANH
jgi:hypothetical protein